MSENNFEKQVQLKMNELRLRPSPEVWEDVEKRIRKEKKRRRFILWFFLFGALLLGGATWWVMDENQKQTTSDNSVTQTIADKKINEINGATKTDTKNETVSEIKLDSNYESKNQKTKVQTVINPAITKKEVALHEKNSVTAPIKNFNKNEKGIKNSVPDVSKKENTGKPKLVLTDIVKNDQPIVNQKTDGADSSIMTDKIIVAGGSKIIKDSADASKSIATTAPMDIARPSFPVLTDSLVTKDTTIVFKKTISKIKKNKWEFGITGMAGTSGTSNGISIFDGQKSLDLSAVSNSTGGSAGPVLITTATEPEKSFSWQLGVYAKRKITTRTGFSVGFDFSSYSTTQLTGVLVDSSGVFNNNRFSSSVSDFYRNGTLVSNKNHYYYLQLPFSFHWQLNKGKKLPLVLQNGFSLGFFTGSDALVYNSGSNVFFRDNKSFNKIQFSYQSGLYAKLFNRSKHPLSAGVLLNYHLSKLQKANINGGNYLTSFGIHLGWTLKK